VREEIAARVLHARNPAPSQPERCTNPQPECCPRSEKMMLSETTSLSLCVMLALACTPGAKASSGAIETGSNGEATRTDLGSGSSANSPAEGTGNTRGTNDVASDAAPTDREPRAGTSSVALEALPAASAEPGAPLAPAQPAPEAAEVADDGSLDPADDGAEEAEPGAANVPPAAGASAPSEDAPEPPASALDQTGTLEAKVDSPVSGEGQRLATALAPAAGNADGNCAVPPEAAAVNTSSPDRVVGSGNPESCSADAFIDAVALGGTITFDCGPDPVVITLDRPAKVFNDAASDVVIDGGGLVTLSGGGASRILYMNTCDPEQHFTTPHCDNQDTPRLTVQNLTFSHGNSTGELEYAGGGAIWARGGQLKVVNSRFFNNSCVETGPDVGGAAIRAFSQFENRPIYVAGSTFGGAPGFGNSCANGGGISSINVSWSIYNSLFSHNRALGNGGNPAEEGTPGGGSGGGIYSDGMSNVLSVCGTRIEDNAVNAYGSGIFFVNNDHGGNLLLQSTVVRNNTGGGWNVLPGVSMHEDTRFELLDTLLE
jgi:hypothetical protein